MWANVLFAGFILYYMNTYPDVEMHFQTDMRKKIYQTTIISQRKY